MAAEPLSGLQSGGGYNAAISGTANMASAMIGSVLANRYVLPPNTIRYDDVVVQETQIDSRVLLVTMATAALIIMTMIAVNR